MTKRWYAWLLLLAGVWCSGGLQMGYAADEAPRKTMVILVDTSGSMQQVEKEVRAALTAFIDGLTVGWRAILVRFDVFSELLESVTITGPPERERLQQRLATLRFRGPKTNFDEGLKGAQAGLFQAGVVDHAAVVIVSDGVSDPSQTKVRVDLVALAQRVFPQQPGYSLYLLTVSPGAHPGDQAPVTQGQVTFMPVSRDNVPEILALVEQGMPMAAPPPQASPPSPPPVVGPSPAPLPAELTPPSKPGTGHGTGRWAPYGLVALALGLAGGGAYLYRAALGRRHFGRRAEQLVRLQPYGTHERPGEFWLGDGESIRFGGGICDYPLSTASTAILTRQNGTLLVCPATSTSDLTLAGQPIQGETPLPPDTGIVFDGHLYVDVQR